jgi:hypothetical protein
MNLLGSGYQLVLLVSSGLGTDRIVAIRTEVVYGLVLYVCLHLLYCGINCRGLIRIRTVFGIFN